MKPAADMLKLRRIALVVPIVFGVLIGVGSCGRVPSTSMGADLTPCAGFRWPVKIGIDPDASSIDLTPQLATIAWLDGIALAKSHFNTRSAPAETTVYELRNITLIRMYTEHDLDYHLLVKDATGKRIDLESPDPSCAGNSVFARQIVSVRHTLDALKPASGSVLSVTGVGFYDVPGSGGMELHPLLSVCVGPDCHP